MRKVNLGVYTCAVRVAVPEQIAYFFQGQAAVDESRGAGMAKSMWSSRANGRPERPPVASDDFKDGTAAKRTRGGAQRRKTSRSSDRGRTSRR